MFRRKTKITTPTPGPTADEVVGAVNSHTTKFVNGAVKTIADRMAALLDAAVLRIEARFERTAEELRQSTQQQETPAAVEVTVPVQQPEPEISFDETDIDEFYASVIRKSVGRAPSSTARGELYYLTVLGTLRNNTIAWVNEELSLFGTLSPEQLAGFGDTEGIGPQPDDRFRAKVVSYPWGHEVIGVVPYSLVSQFALRKPEQRTVNSAGVVPSSVIGTSNERLKPGDIVLARVPYDGTSLPDHKGRMAKMRPSVFIRWESDYALLRAIYDARGYVASNDLGIKLVDTGALDKPSVVRNAEYDIDPGNIVRHLGRLGHRDLNAMNIEEYTEVASAAVAPPPVNYSREDLDEVSREIPQLIASIAPTAVDQPSAVMERLVTAMKTNEVIHRTMKVEGIHHAMVGHIFAEVLRAGGIRSQKGMFRDLMEGILERESTAPGERLVSRRDENNHPVLWFANGANNEPTQVQETGDPEPVPVTYGAPEPRLAIDEEFEQPDLIIYDQEAVGILMQDRRLDLKEALQDLRMGGDADGYIIGSDAEAGWASFQAAARTRGWKSKVADTREEVCSVAVAVAKASGATYVTLVGYIPDVIRDLENEGFEVQIVSMVD